MNELPCLGNLFAKNCRMNGRSLESLESLEPLEPLESLESFRTVRATGRKISNVNLNQKIGSHPVVHHLNPDKCSSHVCVLRSYKVASRVELFGEEYQGQ